MRIRVFLWIITVIVTLNNCAGKINEDEPANNTRKTAQKLENAQTVIGNYFNESGRDIDYYYVTTNTTKLFRGSLTGVKGIDSEILLFRKGEAHPFKTANDNASSLGEKIGPYRIDPPGVVIAVRSRKTVRDEAYRDLEYEFTVDLQAAPDSIESEPNDSIAQAQELNTFHAIGYYNSVYTALQTQEADFYQINLPEKEQYRLSVQLTPVAGIDPVIRLFSENGEKLLVVDSRQAGMGEDILSYGLNGPGKIYVSISAKENGVSDTEPYELTAKISEYDDKYEFEPNDIIDKGTRLVSEKIFADFSSSSDIDYYWYYNQTTEPQAFSVEAVPGGNLDISLQLYIGKTSQPTEFNDAGAEHAEGIASWFLQPGETAYVRVAPVRLDPTQAMDYTLSWKAEPPQENSEREPNNDKAHANPVQTDTLYKGYTNPGTESDYYVIRISKQGSYTIQGEATPDCVLSFTVTDRKGYKTDGGVADGGILNMSAILEPGGYFIVSCSEGAGETSRPLYQSPYTFKFSPKQGAMPN